MSRQLGVILSDNVLAKGWSAIAQLREKFPNLYSPLGDFLGISFSTRRFLGIYSPFGGFFSILFSTRRYFLMSLFFILYKIIFMGESLKN